MRQASRLAIAIAACASVFTLTALADSAGRELRIIPRSPPRSLSVASIDFAEMYRFGDRAPEPTPKLLALQGRRVTLIGFMVLLERPVTGGFYVSPLPAAGDESGGGRGDLPPTSVLVLPAIAAGKPVRFVTGALEVTGVLDVGNREIEGEAATVRLLVDDVRRLRFARTRATASGRRANTTGGIR